MERAGVLQVACIFIWSGKKHLQSNVGRSFSLPGPSRKPNRRSARGSQWRKNRTHCLIFLGGEAKRTSRSKPRERRDSNTGYIAAKQWKKGAKAIKDHED